jgi:2-keto-myo-inositol isomerase
MLLGLNGATTMKASLWKDIEVAKAAGYELIEIWAAKLDAAVAEKGLPAVKAALADSGLKPWAINSIEHISFRNAADERGVKDRCRQFTDIANEIDCKNIVVVPGFAPKGASQKTIVEESVRILHDLSDIAGDIGLAYEFIGGQGLSVGTLGEDKIIVQAANRANVGLVIDTFHFHAGESSFDDFKGLDPAKIFIFHINDVEDLPRADMRDSHRLFPGLGVLPLPEMLANLKKIGYHEMASLEIFRPEYWDMDPLAVAKEGRAAMQKVLGAAGLM